MFTNKLKLSPDKTEFILIGSKTNCRQLLPHSPINILGNQVSPAQNVKNFEVVLTCNLSLSDHASQVIKSTRIHERDVDRMCSLMDLKTSVLTNALVSSRLDYCNSLFVSLTDFELKRLLHVQNSLYRVVTPILSLPSFPISPPPPPICICKNFIGFWSSTGYKSN